MTRPPSSPSSLRGNLTLIFAILACGLSTLSLWRISALATMSHATAEAEETLHLKDHPVLKRLRDVGNVTADNAGAIAAFWREAQLLTENARLETTDDELKALTTEAARVRALLTATLPALIKADDDTASNAPKLVESMAAWARGGSWLALFPNDGTAASAEIAQRLAFTHEQTRQAFLQRHQARYNIMATQQLRTAWSELGALDKLIGRDNAAMARTCRIRLGPLDQGLLDMPTGQLYKQVLEFVQGKISKEDYQQLVQDLLSTTKKTIDE